MIAAVEYLLDPTNPEENQAVALWHLKKAFPRLNPAVEIWHDRSGRSATVLVGDMIRAEAARAQEPEPPYIMHKDLVNNVWFLQEERRNYGARNVRVLVQLDCEFPKAQLPSMIWETHTDASPDEIVAELYSRQGIDPPDSA